LEDLLHIEKDKINDTRLYRCLDRLAAAQEQHRTASEATLWGNSLGAAICTRIMHLIVPNGR